MTKSYEEILECIVSIIADDVEVILRSSKSELESTDTKKLGEYAKILMALRKDARAEMDDFDTSKMSDDDLTRLARDALDNIEEKDE